MNELWGSFNICHGWSQELQKINQFCCHSLTRLTSGTEHQKVQRLEYLVFLSTFQFLESFQSNFDITMMLQ